MKRTLCFLQYSTLVEVKPVKFANCVLLRRCSPVSSLLARVCISDWRISLALPLLLQFVPPEIFAPSLPRIQLLTSPQLVLLPYNFFGEVPLFSLDSNKGYLSVKFTQYYILFDEEVPQQPIHQPPHRKTHPIYMRKFGPAAPRCYFSTLANPTSLAPPSPSVPPINPRLNPFTSQGSSDRVHHVRTPPEVRNRENDDRLNLQRLRNANFLPVRSPEAGTLVLEDGPTEQFAGPEE